MRKRPSDFAEKNKAIVDNRHPQLQMCCCNLQSIYEKQEEYIEDIPMSCVSFTVNSFSLSIIGL